MDPIEADYRHKTDVLRRARFDVAALEEIMFWEDDGAELQVAADPKTTPAALTFLAHHCGAAPEVMGELVDNPSTPGDALGIIVDRLIEYYGTDELAQLPICRALAACSDLPADARAKLPDPA